MARPFSTRLGVRQYTITSEEYLDPGLLTESVVVDQILETGGFIGRLESWAPEDGMRNVEVVKDFIKKPANKEKFHPEWLERETLEHRVLYKILSVHDQTLARKSEEEKAKAATDLTRMQSRMKKDVGSCDFAGDCETGELWQLLACEPAFEVADLVLDNLENKLNTVVYVQNMTMEPHLETCAGVYMSNMKTGLERLSNRPLSGITQPTVYIGTEFSTFGCHREDMSFLAMNRHIAGAPKIWFIVPPAYYEAFIWLLRHLPISDVEKVLACQLSHKDMWICPKTVVGYGIPVFTIVQRPGDIVYLMPNTIHWGFNVGFNVNEAINYVCPIWVLPGMLSHQRCNCYPDWYSRFEIDEVLSDHGATQTQRRMWSSGHTMSILQEIKSTRSLLYTRLHDVAEQCLDKVAMASGVVKALTANEQSASDEDSANYPKCTMCKYSTNRARTDAFERLRQHVGKLHGDQYCDEVVASAMASYERLQEEKKAKKEYKTGEIFCEKCEKTVHGTGISRLMEHQGTKKCQKRAEELAAKRAEALADEEARRAQAQAGPSQAVAGPSQAEAGPSSGVVPKRRRM